MLVLAVLVAFALPQRIEAFELFGIQLFGGDDEEEEQVVLDPLEYSLGFSIDTRDEDLEKAIRRGTTLWADRRDPAAGSAGLISTARGDYRSILSTLYANGYYAGAISIRINGQEAAALELTDRLPSPSKVEVIVDPGPPFRFGETAIRNAPPRSSDTPEQALMVPGTRALADEVDAAGLQARDGWRALGYPVARVADRTIIADHRTDRLDVELVMNPGPRARISEIRVPEPGRVDPIFIRYMADIPEGSVFDPQAIEKAQKRLSRLGVFRAVRITEPDVVSADGTIPLTVETLPRKRRRYGIGATASTLEGLGLQAFWLHRNLLGRAERLRFDAEVSGIGTEGDAENYDYFFGTTFTKPGVGTPDTDFSTGFSISQNVFDTYREREVEAFGGFTRMFSDDLDGSVFLNASLSEVETDTTTERYLTVSAPISLTWDKRDDQLDPREGFLLEGTLQPFHEVEFGSTGLRAIAEGRTYWPIGGDATILALRGRLGTIVGGTRAELPPSLLFFTGGGGSVRGYGFRSNGLEIGGETVGGRSSLELSVEIRRDLTESFGIAGFADAGLVSEDVLPSGRTDAIVGVGAGLRYQTGLGPIRFDVARPLDPGPDDPDIAFYFGIGQAF